MDKEQFLTECEKWLGPQRPGETIGYRSRWRRGAGRGRFEGRGLIRWYSPTSIHFQLTNPCYTGTFTSPEEALAWLRLNKHRRLP